MLIVFRWIERSWAAVNLSPVEWVWLEAEEEETRPTVQWSAGSVQTTDSWLSGPSKSSSEYDASSFLDPLDMCAWRVPLRDSGKALDKWSHQSNWINQIESINQSCLQNDSGTIGWERRGLRNCRTTDCIPGLSLSLSISLSVSVCLTLSLSVSACLCLSLSLSPVSCLTLN